MSMTLTPTFHPVGIVATPRLPLAKPPGITDIQGHTGGHGIDPTRQALARKSDNQLIKKDLK